MGGRPTIPASREQILAATLRTCNAVVNTFAGVPECCLLAVPVGIQALANLGIPDATALPLVVIATNTPPIFNYVDDHGPRGICFPERHYGSTIMTGNTDTQMGGGWGAHLVIRVGNTVLDPTADQFSKLDWGIAAKPCVFDAPTAFLDAPLRGESDYSQWMKVPATGETVLYYTHAPRGLPAPPPWPITAVQQRQLVRDVVAAVTKELARSGLSLPEVKEPHLG